MNLSELFAKISKFFDGVKTHGAVVTGILNTTSQFVNGELTLEQYALYLSGFSALSFLRMGFSKLMKVLNDVNKAIQSLQQLGILNKQ